MADIEFVGVHWIPVLPVGGRAKAGDPYIITLSTQDAPRPHPLQDMLIGIRLKDDAPSAMITQLMHLLRDYAECVGVRIEPRKKKGSAKP